MQKNLFEILNFRATKDHETASRLHGSSNQLLQEVH